MINKKECINLFNKYALKYDLKDKWVMLKFHHTHRVVNYAELLGKSLKLSDKDSNLVFLGALLHDIGRFEQYKQYNTYDDHNSVDHGDMGNEVLLQDDFINKFVTDETDKKIILSCVKNHSKFSIKDLKDKEYLVTSIIRDADKLDILLELNNEINDEKIEIKSEIVDSLLKEKMVSNKLVENDIDYILRSIGFIFDLNYSFSFEFLKEKQIIENKFKLIETYIEINDEYKKLKDFILNYIEKRI